MHLRFAPKRNRRNLCQIFTEVEQNVRNYLTDILMDFERAALNSVCQVYPNIELERILLPFLIKYMEAYSKPWSTEPLSRR